MAVESSKQVEAAITCRKCGGKMLRGHALQNTLTGSPDFIGDDAPVTVSRTGPAKVVPVLKCVKCGHSITADEGAKP